MALFRTPIVVVLGATGAGKSKLALELAQRFKGEIISADAMQMYKGLDIATNKVTDEEMKSVKHHMIDMLDPLKEIVKVSDFRNASLPLLEDMLSKEVIPFICGGTNYYIESLLWNILVDNAGDSEGPYQEDDDFSISTDVLYEELVRLDPERSSTLHRNDRRKIYRSLQIYHRHGGKKHSEFLRDQRGCPGGSHVGGPLRYSNVCFLWVDTALSILDERCDSRVEKMIQRGLIKELEDFHREYNLKRGSNPDYTVGIFQSIGFKEFHDYLNLEEEEKNTSRGQFVLAEGVQALKSATHRYARRQLRWIRQRLLNPLNMSHLPVYRVDSSDPSQWRGCVYEPAMEVVESFIQGQTPHFEPVPLIDMPEFDPEDLKKVFSCEECDMQFKGILQYKAHLGSKKHKNRYRKAKGPLYSLRIQVRSNDSPPKETQVLDLVKILKRMSKGRLGTSDVHVFLKRKEPLDIQIAIREFGARKHLKELEKYNLTGELIPVVIE